MAAILDLFWKLLRGLVPLLHMDGRVIAILMISRKSRLPYWNCVLEIERGLVLLAHLATPMTIESKLMSLSQIQKEL